MGPSIETLKRRLNRLTDMIPSQQNPLLMDGTPTSLWNKLSQLLMVYLRVRRLRRKLKQLNKTLNSKLPRARLKARKTELLQRRRRPRPRSKRRKMPAPRT